MAKEHGRAGRLLGVGVTVVALAAGGAHLIWPRLKIDAITVLLLIVALSPWLGALLESIELPGGWKLQYRALADKVEETEQQANEAASRANEAVSAANVAIGATKTVGASITNSSAAIDELVDEYRRLRSLPNGPARVQQLDQLFGKMTTIVPTVAGFDAAMAINGDEPAVRLAGYALLYHAPDPTMARVMVDALQRERKLTSSFNEYWAIMVLRALVAQNPQVLTADLRDRLASLMDGLPARSSRRAQLAILLSP